jgi:uncharacterized protein (DUF2141 family)
MFIFNLNKNLSFLKRLWLFALLGIFVGCAQVVRPTGGKSDNVAPEVIKFLPENKSLSFKGKAFSIQFNEYFTVKDISKQWIISPPLKTMPEYKIKGKILNITFEDTLKENTTYNFNFGKSIADVNEGNEVLGLTYIFSTGSFIDSLKISGNITRAYNNAKEKDVLVMLYEESRCKEDSFPYKIIPDYFAISDASGKYILKYIKPGKYRAVALKDANSNYLFDSFEEEVGFCDSVINLQSNATLDFKLFKEIEEKTYLKNKTNSQYGCFNLFFNKEIPNLKMEHLHQTQLKDWAIIEMSKFKDTVNIFLQDFSIDTLKLVLKDSLIPIDTVEFAVLPKEKFTAKGKRIIRQSTIIKVNPANGAEKEFNSPISITLNNPVTAINYDSILFFEGKQSLPYTLIKKDVGGRKFEFECKLQSDSNYTLTFLPGAFKDCFGNTNDTTKSKFKLPSVESVGSIYLTVSADSTAQKIDFTKTHLQLQLLNDKGDVLNSQKLSNYETISYLNLKPGTYKAQLIVDANNNNQWDTGNFLKKQQAEKIIPMNATMSLRANWDLEEDWKFRFKE